MSSDGRQGQIPDEGAARPGAPGEADLARRKLELLYRVAKDTSYTLGLKARLDYICRSVGELMAVKGVTLRLLDEKTNKLELMSSYGLSDVYLDKGPVDADRSLARVLKGEPHAVLDVSGDPSVQYPREAVREGLVSMLSFPLRGRDRVIGTLRLYSSQRREFSAEEMDFLAALAGQGAIYIENAKIYEALKRQDEAKGEFIMLMTHELKAPLTAIQGFLNVMRKGYAGTMTPKQLELVGRIERRIKSALAVSAALLDIYQWESRGKEARWVPVAINRQIGRTVDLFEGVAREKGLTLTAECPPEEVTLMATEEDIEKILNNLVTNAIKYTAAGGVWIGLSASENRVVLRVADTGMGIAPEDRPRIFDQFFRSRKAKAVDPEGRGLGLPFVKKIVESLGGRIEVSSEEGKGTQFSLFFRRS